jgi:DoxX-like protein
MQATAIQASFPVVKTSASNKALWTGRILSGLVVLFLLVDAAYKLIRPLPAPAVEAFRKLGYPVEFAAGIGILLLSCVALYLIPRTSILGAILLTGYLGGAVASYVRIGDPWLSHALFPVYIGLLVWGGLYLRDQRLRAFIPLRETAK